MQKLENWALDHNQRSFYEQIEEFVFEVFGTVEPIDADLELAPFKCVGKGCDNQITEVDSFCGKCGVNFGICMLSGRSIFIRKYTKCRICKHKLLNEEIEKKGQKFCPLCHQKLEEASKKDKVAN